MVIKSLPIKVYAQSIHEPNEMGGLWVDLFVAKDFNFTLLPSVHRIDLRIAEHQFKVAASWFGSRINTWKQALSFMRQMEKRWKPFWIEIHDAEVTKIDAAGELRKLNPTFWYELEVKSFAVLDWPNSKIDLSK